MSGSTPPHTKPPRPKDVLLDGAYSIQSAGDDAPLAFLVSALRRRHPDIGLTALVRHPDWPLADRMKIRTLENMEHTSRDAAAGRWFRGLNFCDDRAELGAVANTIAASDLLVLGAGNFLTETGIDVLRGHLPRFCAMTLAAQMAGTPVMLFGLSANRLHHAWSCRAAQWLLDNAAAVTFRERRAIENLEASGVRLPPHAVLPDPALGAPRSPAGTAARILSAEGHPFRSGGRLALAPRELTWISKERHDAYLERQVAILDRWCERRERDVLIVPQCTYDVDGPRTDDRALGSLLRDRAAHPERIRVIEGRYDYDEVESLYGTADVTLATRLHGAVFSARMGTPPVGLAYEHKVAGFFDEIDAPDLCLDLETPPEEVSNQLERVLRDRSQICTRLHERLASLAPRVDEYARIASRLLGETPSLGETDDRTRRRALPTPASP